MSLRRIIVELDPAELNVTEFCADHGISTWFFWNLRRRHRDVGEAALAPRSRAPRRVANKTPLEVEDAIVAKRKELVDAGLDAGPASIAFWLAGLAGLPSESTIWRILKVRGFITPEPSKTPRASLRRVDAQRANDCWQIDDTTWALAGGREVKIINVIDDHSRVLVASLAVPSCTGGAALQAVASGAAVLGWPARLLSDNAKAFRHSLARALDHLGVRASHSRPYHPQTCGKVERFHRTLKTWLAKQPPAVSLAELNTQLDYFRHFYNHQRPHRALNRRPPAQHWAQAPKNGPAQRRLDAATTTHTSLITGGVCRAGRYRIGLGTEHDGATAHTIITADTCHVFINGTLIRALTIDPTRTYQPTGRPPGRRPQLP